MASFLTLITDTLELIKTLKGGLLPHGQLNTLEDIYQAVLHDSKIFPILKSNHKQLNMTNDQAFSPENKEDCAIELDEHLYQQPDEDLMVQSPKKSQVLAQQEIVELLKNLVERIAEGYQVWKENEDRVVQLLNEQHKLSKWQKLIDCSYNLLAQIRLHINSSMLTIGQQPNPEAKSFKESQPDSRSQGLHSSKSSIRSLLTQKLKNLPPELMENEFECVGEKVIIRSNWIMKQIIRRESNQTATQPLKEMSNQSENSPRKNPHSLQIQPFTLLRAISKKNPLPSRSITKEMNLDINSRQRKVKSGDTGCSRCDIY